jgi:pimeloyl-ACP methyl ester carboxylesterase
MLHGFGGGIGAFVANLDDLSHHHKVYVCDIIGFGRSSRPEFTGNKPEEAEAFCVESIKTWVDALKLDKFNLLGHSMGAFLSTLYAIKYPASVLNLLLVDPWGVPQMVKPPSDVSYRFKIVMTLAKFFSSPFTLLRAAGPWGLALMNKVRPDLGGRINDALPGCGEHFMSYVYHCNAQAASGEMAFARMSIPIGWAVRPLVERFAELSPDLPVYAIYGRDTWMDYNAMRKIQRSVLPKLEIVLLPDAGHHVMVDNVFHFNCAVYQAIHKGTMKELMEELKIYQDFPQQRFAR